MSYLKLHEPALFKRFARSRHLDTCIVEAFEDLESVARSPELGDPDTATQVVEIIEELKEELRLRIEACENAQKKE